MAEVLITGGAGFIGSNLAARLLEEGHHVTILDNLSRAGSEANLAWLRSCFAALRLIRADVSDREAVRRAVAGMERIYHLAGQTAVTASVDDPLGDFRANAQGTLELLEAARQGGDNPIFVYASTNKVYGGLGTARVEKAGGRYRLADLPDGVPETFPLDFGSPYGCSKGCGDQYTRDYFRIYGLRTIVMRQSCIYGARQFGLVGQGWLAWFMQSALAGRALRVFGDGGQVRDVLYVDDLLDAYEAAVTRIDATAGEVFNVGGGPENAIAVWNDVEPLLAELAGRPIEVSFAGWRPCDQRVYVSDTRKLKRLAEWRPKTGWREGIHRLGGWVRDNRELFGA